VNLPGGLIDRAGSPLRTTYHLFVRMFDSEIDPQVLERIDRELLLQTADMSIRGVADGNPV